MEQNLIPWSEGYQSDKPAGEIYVVDDDKYMREILEVILTEQGFPVKAFEDGEALLTQAGDRVPICVFLDVIMPGRSGLEILRELRARRHSTPVILMSAQDDLPTVVEAMKSGAHDYIRKPFEPKELVTRVQNAVEMWLSRVETKNRWDPRANDNREWYRLTPDEKNMVLLMRLMDT